LRTWAEEAEVIHYVEFVLSKDIDLIEAELDPNYDNLEDDGDTDAELVDSNKYFKKSLYFTPKQDRAFIRSQSLVAYVFLLREIND
ncbi:45360_t:CDS:2, partial [Gigaspora margarita]